MERTEVVVLGGCVWKKTRSNVTLSGGVDEDEGEQDDDDDGSSSSDGFLLDRTKRGFNKPVTGDVRAMEK